MNKDNKNTELDNIDKKLDISDVMFRFFPFIGGFVTIFREHDFFVRNKMWFIPYHYLLGFLLGGCILYFAVK